MADTKNTETVDAEVINDDIEVYGEGANTDVAAAIEGLNNPDAAFYSSIKNDTFDGRIQVAQALSSSQPLSDNLGVEIALKHFIVQAVQISDDATGNVNEAPRVTLVDADGNAFHATSVGLLASVRNLIAQVGEPETWERPIKIKVVEERGRRGYRYQTIKLIG